MERQGGAKLQQAAPGSIIVETRRNAIHSAPRTPRGLRKVRMEEQWDVGSLDALRGYAPLARDETTARDLDWRHLKHESKEDTIGRDEAADTSDTANSRPATSVVVENTRPTRPPIYHHESSGIIYEDHARDAQQYMHRDSAADEAHVVEIPPHSSRSSSPHRTEYWSPERTPRASAYPQTSRHFAHVEPNSLEEEDIRNASRPRPNRHRTKQRQPAPPRTPPLEMVLAHTKEEDSTLKEVLDELETLRLENEQLRHRNGEPSVPSHPAVLAYTSKVFYQVGRALYLDEPRWEPAEGSGVVLLANNPIRNIGYYLDQHPEIAFAIYKEYHPTPPSDRSKIETKDGVYRSPKPMHEFLSLIAPDMLDAVEELVQRIPHFGDYFPYFDPEGQILAPYLFMYYSAPFLPEVLSELDITSQNLVKQLHAVIDKSYGYEYDSAKFQAEKGMVARKHLKYLIRPGDVLVRNGVGGDLPQACISTGWIERPGAILEESQFEEPDYIQRKRVPRYGPLANSSSSRKLTTYIWEVPAWYWLFDGSFAKFETRIDITMSLGYEEESVEIRNLNVYPLQYASQETRSLLEKRGKTFWSLRNRRFVSYMRSEDDELYNIEDRYMVDTKAYKMLFPNSNIAKLRCKDDFGAAAMARDQPPEEGDALLAMPPTIMAHNLQEKQWREILVDRITDVAWNKQAFKDLVAEPETKELVQALVMKQLNAKKSTDFVAGKGNGLIMLLHGAPGTGKTFTAEGVAEFAEKPLLRVTCGDVGTDAEVVDQRLRATFQLGKMWDCVVLLDEADVFLEERDMKDLKRNALVSVFLRALEYDEGILILTSNRVGTSKVDEAFKSRIQLALHYDNLGLIQRKKIWRNFIARMKMLEESSSTDLEDILDHIDELSKEPMNGREIRNAITIARQLAQFREQPFQYSHLKHAISVGSRFSKYLKDLRMNYTDDMIKQDSGIRFSYTAAPDGLE